MDRSPEADHKKLWDLIKDEHTAVLVTIAEDGSLDSRPMGCLQKEFDGTLWFMTFADSAKRSEIDSNQNVLVSYARPAKYEFISVSGRARIVNDHAALCSLWSEALRVWFPQGPDSPDLALVAIDVDMAKTWTKPASMVTYGYYYLRARLTGKAPTADEAAKLETIKM